MAKKQIKNKFPKNVLKSGKKLLAKVKQRWQNFRSRRPHRTFRLTKRRDYRRSFKIAGYWTFTFEVLGLLLRNKRLFLSFIVFYALLSAVLVGLSSQESYANLSEGLQGQDLVSVPLFETGILFAAAVTGMLNDAPSESQGIMSAFLLLFGWLIVVWLVRQRLAGHAVKLRDGIYSSGSPILATLVVALVIAVQLLPMAIGFIAYSTLQMSGLIQFGVEAMVAWVVIILLTTLSLYWVVPSFIGLVIITLPGMYPFQALKTAGDLVVGRRLKIFLRLVWLVLSIAVLWLIVLVPVILIDQALNTLWLPLVPVSTLLLGVVTIVWASTYIYLLYRRLIDGEARRARAN